MGGASKQTEHGGPHLKCKHQGGIEGTGAQGYPSYTLGLRPIPATGDPILKNKTNSAHKPTTSYVTKGITFYFLDNI